MEALVSHFGANPLKIPKICSPPLGTTLIEILQALLIRTPTR
jgi:hypothetical protein